MKKKVIKPMKKKVIKIKKNAEQKVSLARQNYLGNRDTMLADFNACLDEVQKPAPSVGGVIAGMDYQQFSAISIFRMIQEQKECIAYAEEHKPDYVIVKEEKNILKDMIKRTKKVFGKDYKKWYNHTKE